MAEHAVSGRTRQVNSNTILNQPFAQASHVASALGTDKAKWRVDGGRVSPVKPWKPPQDMNSMKLVILSISFHEKRLQTML